MSSEPKSSEPKYPVGSSVVCKYFGLHKQCIVYNFFPRDCVYTVYPLSNPDEHYSAREDQLSPWVEPGQPKFKVGDAVRKIGVANVKRYIHRVRLNSNNKYRYEMYWVGIGGHKNYNGLSNEREEDYELWTESKYLPGQVIQLTHDKKIVVEAVYKKEDTTLIDFVEYFHDKPVTQYKEILEESLDDKIKVHEYQKNMEILTKDNQTYTNEQGGKQSFVSARFDCIPPVVLRLLAQCLGFGARKYGKDNWKQIEQWDHLSHAMNHINEWNRGDRSEPHLVNAMARLTFALWQAVEQGQQSDTYIHPDEVK